MKAEREAYVKRIADDVEDLSHNKMGSVFRNIKLLSDLIPSHYVLQPDEEILTLWRQHFEEALNNQPGALSPTLDNEAESIPQSSSPQ